MTELQRRHKILKLEHEKLNFMKENKAKLFFKKGYDWQHKFWRDGKYNKQRLVLAGNQVGKTSLTCAETNYHLTQDYPDGWEGYRFNHPINCWALGGTAEQIKRVLQNRLLGEIEGDYAEGGWIASSNIISSSFVRWSGLRGSLKEVKIKSAAGASKISFISYVQDNIAMMGDIVDLILIDEEPKDASVYPQLLIRTLNGDRKRGGLIMLAFTPELGHTEIYEQFTANLQPQQSLIRAEWDEAAHLTPERKKQMLEALPPHEREMRSKGIAQLGSGGVYPVMDEYLHDNIEVMPAHFPRLCGIDFGYNFTGLVWGAWDRDTDILHVYDCLKIEQQTPAEISLMIRGRGEWIPVAWPMDGHLPERGSGLPQKDLYVKHGVSMLDKHATDAEGSVSVEAGTMRLLERMKAGKLKIAPHLKEIFIEKRLYRREKGKIVKKNDHLLDALRYLEMMLRYAKLKTEKGGGSLQPNYIPKRFNLR